MKIAVAVLLAIAAARKGINPQPTIDLRYGEIGPDTAKEHIVGAVVFKKEKPEGAWSTDDLKVTFTPKNIEIPAIMPGCYQGIGKITMKNTGFEEVSLTGCSEDTFISGEYWLKASDESTKKFAGGIYTDMKNTYNANETSAGGFYENRKLFNQQGEPETTIEWTMPNAKKIQEATDKVIKKVKEGKKQ